MSGSSLLMLCPVEVRIRIYEYVFGENANVRLNCFGLGRPAEDIPTEPHGLALTRVSRRIRRECMHIVWRYGEFWSDVRDPFYNYVRREEGRYVRAVGLSVTRGPLSTTRQLYDTLARWPAHLVRLERLVFSINDAIPYDGEGVDLHQVVDLLLSLISRLAYLDTLVLRSPPAYAEGVEHFYRHLGAIGVALGAGVVSLPSSVVLTGLSRAPRTRGLRHQGSRFGLVWEAVVSSSS